MGNLLQVPGFVKDNPEKLQLAYEVLKIQSKLVKNI